MRPIYPNTCTNTHDSIVFRWAFTPFDHQWALAEHDAVAGSPPFFSGNMSDTVGAADHSIITFSSLSFIFSLLSFIFWPDWCTFFQERLLLITANMRFYILSTPEGVHLPFLSLEIESKCLNLCLICMTVSVAIYYKPWPTKPCGN